MLKNYNNLNPIGTKINLKIFHVCMSLHADLHIHVCSFSYILQYIKAILFPQQLCIRKNHLLGRWCIFVCFRTYYDTILKIKQIYLSGNQKKNCLRCKFLLQLEIAFIFPFDQSKRKTYAKIFEWEQKVKQSEWKSRQNAFHDQEYSV